MGSDIYFKAFIEHAYTSHYCREIQLCFKKWGNNLNEKRKFERKVSEIKHSFILASPSPWLFDSGPHVACNGD